MSQILHFKTPWRNLNLLWFTTALVKDFIRVSKDSLRIGAEMPWKARSRKTITVTRPSVPVRSAKIESETPKSFLPCLNILAALFKLTSTEGELNDVFLVLHCETTSNTWVCIPPEHCPDHSWLIRKWDAGTSVWQDVPKVRDLVRLSCLQSLSCV